jgi:hypothetical protein
MPYEAAVVKLPPGTPLRTRPYALSGFITAIYPKFR